MSYPSRVSTYLNPLSLTVSFMSLGRFILLFLYLTDVYATTRTMTPNCPCPTASTLPDDLQDMVLKYAITNIKQVSECRRVCKQWNRITQDQTRPRPVSPQKALHLAAQSISPMNTVTAQLGVLKQFQNPDSRVKDMCRVESDLYLEILLNMEAPLTMMERWLTMETKRVNNVPVQKVLSRLAIYRAFGEYCRSEKVYVWYLNQLGSSRDAQMERWLLQKAIEKQFDKVMGLEYFKEYLHQDEPTIPLLVSLMQGNRLDRIQLDWTQNKDRIISASSQCHLCQDRQVKQVLDQLYAVHSVDTISPLLLNAACFSGHVRLLKWTLKKYPRWQMTVQQWHQAIVSGRLSAVLFLHQHFPSFPLTPTPILERAIFTHIMSFDVLNHMLVDHQVLNSMDTLELEQVLRIYLNEGCGDEPTMKSFAALAHHPKLQLAENHLKYAISRQDVSFPGHITCPRNSSMQMIQYLVEKAHIRPSMESLQYAIRRGRLDIVQYVSDKGSLKITRNEFHYLEKEVQNGLQESTLVPYLINKMGIQGEEKKTISSLVSKEMNQMARRKNEQDGQPMCDCYIRDIKTWLQGLN